MGPIPTSGMIAAENFQTSLICLFTVSLLRRIRNRTRLSFLTPMREVTVKHHQLKLFFYKLPIYN